MRYKLCYLSSFILLNFSHPTNNDMAVRNKVLLGKWRDILRIQALAWPLAQLAAMRLDAVFWKGLALAVHGASSDSPAMKLLSERQVS